MLKKLRYIITALFIFCFSPIKAQVWYPEGHYNAGTPLAITADNQSIFVISKVGIQNNQSIWQASKWDGKFWFKMPLLHLDKMAEITSMKVYQTALYVAGNFSFSNDSFNALVRFKAGRWEGISKFKKADTKNGNITALNVYDNKLLIGGNFNYAGKDSIPFLTAYNGLIYSYALANCKTCTPDNTINDIAVSDSAVAISGNFTRIAGRKSKYLFILKDGSKVDTFITLPKVIEKIALNNKTLYGSFEISGYKKIFKVTPTYSDIVFNLDSMRRLSKILWFDGALWASGSFKINGDVNEHQIINLENGQWKNVTNNYSRVNQILETRGMLFATGNADKRISIWNDNKSVMRFYKNHTLLGVKVFVDSNSNCVKDANEKGIGKQFIKTSLINRGVFTLDNGYSEFLIANNQTTYKFEIRPLRNYIKSSCADTSVSKTLQVGKYIDSIQFPLRKRPNVNDVRIFLVSPKGYQVQKNKRLDYIISVANVGSNNLSGSVKLNVNKNLSNASTTPPATEAKDSIFTWTYLSLKPDETRFYRFSAFANDTFFEPNKQFTAQASASFLGMDNGYGDDDKDSISQSVVNSNNPFRKYTSPSPNPGDSVSYLPFNNRQIRYDIIINNYTSDTVFNAVISDTLDLNLDMSYIQETGSNKPYFTEIQTDPNNNYRGIIIWHFNNIKLPPNPAKNFEQLSSSAYIGFKVVMKANSTGNLIKNTAAVFFDNEFVGKSNIAYCAVLNTGIDKIKYSKENSMIYPNPNNGILYFKPTFLANDNIKILNTEGKIVYHNKFNENTANFSLNTSQLNNGLYIVKYTINGKLKAEKLIIE